MVDLTALADVGHYFGLDVQLSPTGDLARVTRSERSRQRVLRRLLTNPGDMIFHPTYGGGLAGFIGTNATPDEIAGVIRAQMMLEDTVDQTQPIVITVTPFLGGLSVTGSYITQPDQEPVPLSFSVEV